ncbi:MAG TPA: trypsin-like peptidase domain-containing protein [Streptosporangiaceae bacterium]
MDASALWSTRVLASLGAAVLAAAVVTACSSGSGASSGAAATASGSLSGLQSQYEHVVQAVLPSVVQISTSDSTGSGVVYDSKGDIVTNAHVVGDASKVQVRPSTSSKQIPATVVGSFPPDDLAVVRVDSDADSLKPATFDTAEDEKVGEIVLAMGNPLGLTDSVTQGIVSATGRTVGGTSEGSGAQASALITSAIQTSAPINPGNSGGALVDLADQVVGIPTLAARDPAAGTAAQGIGFAIPSSTVKNIAGQLIADGKVTHSDRAALGIAAETMANGQGQPAGVAVVDVKAGGPADKAGISAGDVITALNDHDTPSLAALEGELAQLNPGQEAKVQLHAPGGGSRTVTVTLGSLGSQ